MRAGSRSQPRDTEQEAREAKAGQPRVRPGKEEGRGQAGRSRSGREEQVRQGGAGSGREEPGQAGRSRVG